MSEQAEGQSVVTCPFLAMAALAREQGTSRATTPGTTNADCACQRTRCEWWVREPSDRFGRCAVAKIAEWLPLLQGSIEQIR